ncbi:MAG TPA: hypothetical protein PKM41_01675 [Deltaproteobacteria bacterium]|nr:hypothetical protein [Deltaproteobacteria bacterium]HOI07068.1 hypothetical protein [Deltaproteobacteria bacterium]
MKRMLACLVLAGYALLIPGCASEPRQGLIVTRFQDIKPDEPPPPVDLFGPGEVPSAYVYGFDDQSVTLEIFDISTGEPMKKQTTYIPRGKDYYWVFSELPAGSYKAIVSTGGTSREMRLFNVRR